MLFILIPAIWIAIAAFFLGLCRTAARGDRALATTPRRGTRSQSFPGLVLFEDSGERRVHDERLGTRPSQPTPSTRRTRPVRGRRAGCIAR